MSSSIAAATESGVEDMMPNSRYATFRNSFDAVSTWILGVAFLLAGFPHWSNSYYFLGSIYAYKLVDPGVGQIAAMGMPIIQLVLALCFLTRTFLDAAHTATLFFLIGFATIQTSAYIRGLDISCGCFGPQNSSTIGWFSLSIVYGLLLISLIRNAMFVFSQPATTSQNNYHVQS